MPSTSPGRRSGACGTFAPKRRSCRQPTAIAERVAWVDYRRVVLDSAARTIFLPAAGMKLGLGGIAKGYALERAAALLGERGFEDFLLVSGGQVYARGTRGGRPWQVGVRDPRGARDEIFATLPLAAGSLSTSADNESFFVVEGVRYHHILDPKTGWPAQGLRSATVLARRPDAGRRTLDGGPGARAERGSRGRHAARRRSAGGRRARARSP